MRLCASEKCLHHAAPMRASIFCIEKAAMMQEHPNACPLTERKSPIGCIGPVKPARVCQASLVYRPLGHLVHVIQTLLFV